MRLGGCRFMAWRKIGLVCAAAGLAALGAAQALADAAVDGGSGAYTAATVVSPADDAAVRANGGNLTVQVEVLPPLQGGHRAQVLLDGAAQGAPQQTLDFTFTNLDRGTHTLQAQVVDETDNIVFTGTTTTFHLLRHSRLHP